MKISKKAQFAIQSMLKLAVNFRNESVTLVEITKDQEISLSYLEQLFSSLRKEGLVQGVRGPGGGYQLSKSPGLINVAEIIHAVDNPKCNSKASIDQADTESCITNLIWDDFSEQLSEYLSSITLHDLIKDHVITKNQFQLDETTKRISSMFPVTPRLQCA